MTNEMLSFFPLPAPGEHIFSILARYHYMILSSQDMQLTIRNVFGGSRQINLKAAWRPEFDKLWSFYGGILDRKELLTWHTPYYFDAKFLFTEQCNNIENRKLDQALSFNGTTNITHSKYWRWCEMCVEDDYDTQGFRYWHTQHQIPSMLMCAKHNLPLSGLCAHCGYFTASLVKIQLSPKGNACPRCSMRIEPSRTSLSDEQHWLECFSKKLLDSKRLGCRATVASILRYALNCPMTESSLTKVDRTQLRQAQDYLNHWVDKGAYKPYFCLVDHQGGRPPNPYSLNLIHLMYRDGNYHPICYFAALTAFCSKEEISQALL
ncbi:TniQ family protein [Pseudoalteromonas sp. P80D2]|uniref:TniQ family protein n=1 Tax=Pseudoalteromonas sp. P80D2 TaxID=3113903 RepID=UPI002FC5E85F